MNRRCTGFALLVLGVATGSLAPATSAEEKVDQAIAVGQARAKEGKASQQRIDALSDQADALLREFRQVNQEIEGLKVYNELLEKQVDNQVQEIEDLAVSIGQVALIERHVVPLMVRMVDALDAFIELDVPFLAGERRARVERLRAMLERSDVTVAEKFRRVLEVYQIENDYGRTIEAYRGSLETEGRGREVDFLRVGRVALLYQTHDGAVTGAWDNAARDWVGLPARTYRSAVAKGLRIARKQVAPDLLTLPVAAAEPRP